MARHASWRGNGHVRRRPQKKSFDIAAVQVALRAPVRKIIDTTMDEGKASVSQKFGCAAQSLQKYAFASLVGRSNRWTMVRQHAYKDIVVLPTELSDDADIIPTLLVIRR